MTVANYAIDMDNMLIFLSSNRRFYPCSISIQLPVWSAAQPWPHAVRQDGQQHGGPGDCPQCLWSYRTLGSR